MDYRVLQAQLELHHRKIPLLTNLYISKEKIDDFYNLCFYTIVNKRVACVTNIGESMKPTIKTLIFGFVLCLGGLIAKKVYANNHGNCHAKKAMQHHREAIKAISKDVDLTDEKRCV